MDKNIMETEKNRAILLGAKITLSPEVQPLKEKAIDFIVKQSLYLAYEFGPLTEVEMEKLDLFSLSKGIRVLTGKDISGALKRLRADGLIDRSKKGNEYAYIIGERVYEELKTTKRMTETKINNTVSRVFRGPLEPNIYKQPFLECLSHIFSQLTEDYVNKFRGEITAGQFVMRKAPEEAIRKITDKYENLDPALFKKGLTNFFLEEHPDHVELIWNYAQNYYLAKALGFDPTGSILSKEIFKDAVFYLDTNVVIPALEPEERRHATFRDLNEICRKIGIELKVVSITINELRQVVIWYKDLIRTVEETIPDETKPKIRGIFYKIYNLKKRENSEVDIDEAFENFSRPVSILDNDYGIGIEDDVWFRENEEKPNTKHMKDLVTSTYYELRGRRKNPATSMHDALLLLWVNKKRKESKTNTWLVTCDSTLPYCLTKYIAGCEKPLAITLDALTQWLAPIAISEGFSEGFPEVYAEALRLQLLPSDKIFELKDFYVFQAIEYSCKEYPAEDVENCVIHIRSELPGVNPYDPKDLQKLSLEINRFFSAPDRAYKKRLEELESEIGTQKELYESQLEEQKEKSKADKALFDTEIERKNNEVKTLTDRVKETETAALRSGAYLRLLIFMPVLIIGVAIIGFLANRYSTGDNLFQKLLNAWEFFAGFLGAWLVGAASLVGRKRLKYLWPFFHRVADD